MRASLRQLLFTPATGLDLNFAGGVFSLNSIRTATPASIPGWSYTRTGTATSIATALDLAGNVIQFPSRTNLTVWSRDYSNAAWLKLAGSSVTGTNIINITSEVNSRVEQSFPAITGDTVTCSAVVSGSGQVRLAVVDNGGSYGGTFLLINLTATPTRYSVTRTITEAGITSAIHRFQANVSNTAVSFTADQSQSEIGSTATAYIPTTTAAVTVTPPRITNRGILVEEARTNSLRNSVAAGAVAGSPGTLPTNWSVFFGGTGLTRTVVGTGTINGVNYIDVRFNGTTGSTTLNLSFETSTQVVTATSQAWTNSVFVALVSGSLSNVDAVRLSMNNYDSSVVFLSQQQGSDFKSALSSTLSRQAQTLTISSALTARSMPYIDIGYSLGVAVDFTLRLGFPQFELGAFATSPIITTGAAGTRGTDTVSVGSFILPTAYTWVADAVCPVLVSGTFPAPMGSSGVNVGFFVNGSDGGISANMGNATFNNSSGAFTSASTFFKTAFRSQADNAKLAGNGTLGTVDTAFTSVTGARTISIGANSSSAGIWNSYVQRIRILPTALPDAQLQALTAP